MEMSLFDRVVAFEEQKHGVKFKIQVDSIYIKLHPDSAGIFNQFTKTIHVRSRSSFYTLLHEMGHFVMRKNYLKEALMEVIKRASICVLPFTLLISLFQILGFPSWLNWIILAAQWAVLIFDIDKRIFGEVPWKEEGELLAEKFAEEERLDLVEKSIFVELEWRREIRS